LRGKELQVANRRVRRYPKEFRRMAGARLKNCDNIVALARELGVHRRLLYKWQDQLEPVEPGGRTSTELAGNAPAGPSVETAAGGEDDGSGFFPKCIAKSRGSTPAEQKPASIAGGYEECLTSDGVWTVKLASQAAILGVTSLLHALIR
jgi:hypothetical protein